jgi:hypothetical protein
MKVMKSPTPVAIVAAMKAKPATARRELKTKNKSSRHVADVKGARQTARPSRRS